MGQENCETRWDYAKEWHGKCMNHITSMKRSWKDLWNPELAKTNQRGKVGGKSIREQMLEGCVDTTDLGTLSYTKKPIISYHDKVFIISALWDYNYHHFLSDSLARLAKYYLFLKANPEIKIHIRHFEDYDSMYVDDQPFREKSDLLKLRFMDLLDLDPSRFVTGMVVANEVYLPRNMRCAWSLSNAIEIRQLARLLINAAHSYIHDPVKKVKVNPEMMAVVPVGFDREKEKEKELERLRQPPVKTLIILQRTQDGSDRSWDNTSFAHVIASFQGAFPNHKIIPLSENRNNDPSYCLACDITVFNHADVLVGEHGAGLTNMMFMPKGSLVVEFVGVMKDVTMPICGYYGPYAAIMGHHHYIHTYDREGGGSMNPHIAAERSGKLYQKLHGSPQEFADVTRVKEVPIAP
jgi:hypothetical protein